MQAISSLGSAQRLRRLELKQALPKHPPPFSRLQVASLLLRSPGAGGLSCLHLLEDILSH